MNRFYRAALRLGCRRARSAPALRATLVAALTGTALAGSAFGLVAGAGTPPTLELTATSVSADDVTANGYSVLFSVSREQLPWMVRTVPLAEPLFDGDGDGLVTFFPNGGVAGQSIWALVDTATGGVSVSTPEGYQPEQVTADPYSLFASPGHFSDQRQRLIVLLVRPGVGAWYGRFHDGGSGDVGPGSDGGVVAQFTSFERIWPQLGKPGGIKSIQSGDVIVGIDPTFMTYYLLEVGP